jgi:hypothetical protein
MLIFFKFPAEVVISATLQQVLKIPDFEPGKMKI